MSPEHLQKKQLQPAHGAAACSSSAQTTADESGVRCALGLMPVVKNKTPRVLAAETPGNYLIDSMISTLEQQPAALRLKAEAH